jgi:4'-phosphopantetheinyl transferase
MPNTLHNEAHVYLAFTDRYSDPKTLAWYKNLLSDVELEKYKSFYFTRDRDLYLLTHGLVRSTLSRYVNKDPDKWVFNRTFHGRPEIDQSEENFHLRFSASRTPGLVACVIVLSIDAGVDVEAIRKFDNLETLSEHVFTPREISKLRGLSENEQMECFFTLWTLKEAYIKAKGRGFALPLNQFSFCSDWKNGIRIALSPELQDVPSNWQFASYRSRHSHSISVALDRKDSPDFLIRFFEAIPHSKGPSFSCLSECSSELRGVIPQSQ